ncbi:MAG: Gfo/Idh/MocA family oxidoreductase [Kiritimatiellae bacterium]|nr:Gfo/Idh/MocA family oxidoreductase [Kiritimatiellia bacterium]
MAKLSVSRRRFLEGALSFPVIISSGCIGIRKGMVAPKRPQPSERINVGFIGYGTMAHDNIGNFLNNQNVQVVAVSDPNKGTDKLYGYNGARGGGMRPCKERVDKFYADQKGAVAYNGCKTFPDFRDLLDCGVDAVVISTPDHWHAMNAIYAMRKGKHVYCQKPMSLTIGQGKAMVRAARETGVTFQVGSQQRSATEFRRACEFVRNGYLGKIQRVEIGLPGGKFNPWGKEGEWIEKKTWAKPPEYFGEEGFRMWQGGAALRAFNPAIHSPMSWRFNLAYGGGMITDWGAHHLDILQWAIGKDGSGPVAVENIKGDIDLSDPLWNTAGEYSFEVVYADGTRAFVSNKYANGLRFFGEDGKQIFVTRGKMETAPAELYRTKLKDTDQKLYVSGQHERNFIECIYSGQPTITPCEVGHRSITISHIANIGLRIGASKLAWDPAAELFTGADADKANALIDLPLHNGWVLDPGA